MPDMTTLLIIPEYQLKLGSRVGGGAFGLVYRGVRYKGPISPGFAKHVDNMFADLEKPKFVPLDSLVEDNTYVSTEQEYLTMEDEEEKEVQSSAVYEQKPESEDLTHAIDTSTSEFKLISPPGTYKKSTQNLTDSEKAGKDFQMENVEKQVVAIKVLNDETDPSTSRALLEEARVSLMLTRVEVSSALSVIGTVKWPIAAPD